MIASSDSSKAAVSNEMFGSNATEAKMIDSGAALTASKPVASSVYCFRCLPSPTLKLLSKEPYTVRGKNFTLYRLTVVNRDDYPASLFKASPTLPPCGLNKNSSRTWVYIFDQNKKYIYGFCALSQPADLNLIWFAVPVGTAPPKAVYINMTDRACNTTWTSNLLKLP
jgi:hypothetical protein